MQPIDFILIFIVLAVSAAAAFAIVRSKKKGCACMGCPHSGSCPSRCGCHKDPE